MKSPLTKSEKETLRQKALKVWEKKSNKPTSQLSENEALKLIHELQVHKIELELMNEELIQAKKEAEIAVEKYISLFDFAPSGYFTLSKEAQIIDLNIKGAEMLGKERAFLKKQNFYNFVSCVSKPVFTDFIEKVFKNRETETSEITMLNVDKSPLCVFLTGIAKEKEVQCLINMIDITLFKKLEDDLVRAKERAEENDRLKTAFLQNMSHEIRTPMNAIMGFSDLIKENLNNKTRLENFSSIINQRSVDLLEIIDDILDISKIESGQLPIHIEECNLSFLFGELLSFFKAYQKRINKPHINFSLQTAFKSENVILTDKVKLKQIFINLISNAFKFTNEGKIEAGCKFDENRNLLFYVSDTGIGIPLDKQEFIFNRFTQLKQGSNNNTGGTGLGLSIVKGLLNLLGGEIFLESEPSKGSTFTFTLPYKTIQPLTQAPLEVEEYNTKCLSNKNILIVEDDVFTSRYLKEILSDTGLQLVFAKTGNEALQILANQSLDLVLMDIRLPDMDGYEAIHQIKQRLPNLNIIAQTAFASHEDKQKTLNAGCIDFISKPLNRELLFKMLNQYL